MSEELDKPAIVVSGLTKIFGDVRAVDGLDFTVSQGQTVALLGGNGAGKTTTISMLLGLLLPSAGDIHIFGQELQAARYDLLARMNFSSPYVDLPHRLSVRETLTVYSHLYGIPDVAGRIEELVEKLDLKAVIDRRTGSLSAGQKTRVALAKALLNHPELLLLDEPTASLDPDTADWVRNYLMSWRAEAGATIFLASHNMTEVERICDHVMIMREGRLFDQGTPVGLIERYGRVNLEEVFLDIARDRRNGEGR
jgi:ABC-2 type transport system ATP-binding protein